MISSEKHINSNLILAVAYKVHCKGNLHHNPPSSSLAAVSRFLQYFHLRRSKWNPREPRRTKKISSIATILSNSIVYISTIFGLPSSPSRHHSLIPEFPVALPPLLPPNPLCRHHHPYKQKRVLVTSDRIVIRMRPRPNKVRYARHDSE